MFCKFKIVFLFESYFLSAISSKTGISSGKPIKCRVLHFSRVVKTIRPIRSRVSCFLTCEQSRMSHVNKHLLTGPKGNSEFCFPETLNVPRGEAEGNIEVEGKQNSLFPEGPVIKCFVIPPNSK